MTKAYPGTYALVLASSVDALVRVGKLGRLHLQPGFYVYVGSAHGPGGLQARLAHHWEPTGRPHWHIDFLVAHTKPREVWFCYDRFPWECRWAYCLSLQGGAPVPLVGFGSSDCTCEAHLFFFRRRPSKAAFARSLRASNRRHPPVRVCKLK
jgi:Uri superfamily endonuclease